MLDDFRRAVLEILRFSQNDKLNDTLSISAVVVLGGLLNAAVSFCL